MISHVAVVAVVSLSGGGFVAWCWFVGPFVRGGSVVRFSFFLSLFFFKLALGIVVWAPTLNWR